MPSRNDRTLGADRRAVRRDRGVRAAGDAAVVGQPSGSDGIIYVSQAQSGGVHVVSSDAPSVRTLWEFERLYCVDRGFRDDKSSCFGLERVRISKPERLERLLFGLAVAELVLKSLATDCLLRGDAWEVDENIAGGLSLLQVGARLLRRSIWNGRTPILRLGLLPDSSVRDTVAERRTLRRFYRRLGIEPGRRWIPPNSFEERNVMWWLPGPTKRYPPRMPVGDPPVL